MRHVGWIVADVGNFVSNGRVARGWLYQRDLNLVYLVNCRGDSIDRYREATISYGYEGDSIINSMADIALMIVGFFLASRLPWKATLAIAVIFELFTGYMIRDNLALNILMLTVPIEAVKDWQAAGTGYWLTGKT